MLDIDQKGLVCNSNEKEFMQLPLDKLEYELEHPTDIRFLLLPIALKQGISVDRIYELTWIDKWFLYKIQHIIEMERDA